MKKILAIVGSQRKGGTFELVKAFEISLKAIADIEMETVFLKDYRLEFCKGCKLCFDKGEELCPHKDDRDIILEKINKADGVIFATPNYSFQLSAAMKNLLDRLAYIFHRPQFFGKVFMGMVVQGIFGGNAIIKYLSAMGENFGFSTVKGIVVNTLEPMTDAQHKAIEKEAAKAAKRFAKELARSKPSRPSLFRLLMFRMSRSTIQARLDDSWSDYRYYKDKGWFKSGYYYQTRLGPIKSLLGGLFDWMGKGMSKGMAKNG